MTIAEIAAQAGVSKASVSRYLNNGYVSEEKRERIRRVIEETGYVPSRQAQQLRTGRTRMVGVILPRIDSESISRVVRGISQVLDRAGFQIILANTENDEKKELEYLEVFRKGRVDGILLVATVLTAAHHRAIRQREVPLVVIGQEVPECPSVFHDDIGAARALTERMLNAGRHRLAYIGVTPKDKAVGAGRRAGVEQALAAAGLALDETLCEQTPFSLEGGRDACMRLLQRGADFDALFCATDSIAAGAMQALIEAGRRVPKDVMVTGVGHGRLSGFLQPPLTTAHYYYEKSGMEAARLLLEQIEDPENADDRQIRLGFELIEQGSTKV